MGVNGGLEPASAGGWGCAGLGVIGASLGMVARGSAGSRDAARGGNGWMAGSGRQGQWGDGLVATPEAAGWGGLSDPSIFQSWNP